MRGWRQSGGETTGGSTASEQPHLPLEIRAHAETIIRPREAADDVSIVSVLFTLIILNHFPSTVIPKYTYVYRTYIHDVE